MKYGRNAVVSFFSFLLSSGLLEMNWMSLDLRLTGRRVKERRKRQTPILFLSFLHHLAGDERDYWHWPG